MTTSEIIYQYRREHNLSQDEFGQKVGVNRAAVSKWEKGHVKEMKGKTILNICRLIGITPYELMGWDEEFNQFGKLNNEVKLIEAVQFQYGKSAVELLGNFIKLNSIGKEKAIENIIDLTSIPKYIIQDNVQQKGDAKAL